MVLPLLKQRGKNIHQAKFKVIGTLSVQATTVHAFPCLHNKDKDTFLIA